jgi:hypothetical protein
MRIRLATARTLMAVGLSALVLSPLTANAASHHVAARPSTTWTGARAFPAAKGIGLKRNEDGEPGMGVTPSGQFWVASDIAPYGNDPRILGGLLSGADIWTSTNGGRSYRWVSDPFGTSNGQSGLGGEDTDLAVAPKKNAAGFYNVYAASLWIGSSSLASSQDGGKTWQVNPLGGIPTQDRPWLAADGPCDVYVTYHQLPLFTPTVSQYDVCTAGTGVPVKTGVALDPTHSTTLTLSSFPGLSGSFNKPTVDTSPHSKFDHRIYVPMSLCQVASAPDLVVNANSSNCPKGTQYIVAVSDDSGQTFTYHRVVLDKSGSTLVWAATIGTDAHGTAYFAWSDSKNVYLDISKDGGVHWTKPRRLNHAHTAAVYPTVAGGGAGRVDIAWYGTNRSGDSNNAKLMGAASVHGSRVWKVYVDRSRNSGRTFALRAVTAAIHLGELCTHGSGCSDTNSRNLLDDFGVAISPRTGRDSIALTDDRPDGQAAHAFTAFTTELPRLQSKSESAATSPSKTSTNSASASSTASASLATTGLSPLVGLAGVVLVAAGLALRRPVRH